MKKEDLAGMLHRFFPTLNHPGLSELILEKAAFLSIPSGKTILNSGEYIHAIPLVVKGSIKVVRVDESGHKVLPYYIYLSSITARLYGRNL